MVNQTKGDILSNPLFTGPSGTKKTGFARIFDFDIEFKEDPFQIRGKKFGETKFIQDILFLLDKLGVYELEVNLTNDDSSFIPTPDAELEIEIKTFPVIDISKLPLSERRLGVRRTTKTKRTGPKVTKKTILKVPKLREKGGRPQESNLLFSLPNITKSFNVNSLKNQIFSDPFKFINMSPFLIEEINKNKI